MDENKNIIEFIPGKSSLPFHLKTDKRHIIKAISDSKKSFLLELEDVNFHFDSCVLMPSILLEQENKITPQNINTGIGSIRAVVEFIKEKGGKYILFAGHTDTSGSKEYNQKLSKKRADNAYNFFIGEDKKWAELCQAHHQVEDWQHILKWISQSRGWDTDPGKVDNINGTKSKKGLSNFRSIYNEAYNKNLHESGPISIEDWQAFFAMYEDELRWQMSCTKDELEQIRSKANFVDPPIVGCGEQWPIEKSGIDGVRSSINRRVEIWIFDEAEKPALICHSYDKCQKDQCPVYGKKYKKIITRLSPSILPKPEITYITSAQKVIVNSPSLDLTDKSNQNQKISPKTQETAGEDIDMSFNLSALKWHEQYSVALAMSATAVFPQLRYHNNGICRHIGLMCEKNALRAFADIDDEPVKLLVLEDVEVDEVDFDEEPALPSKDA